MDGWCEHAGRVPIATWRLAALLARQASVPVRVVECGDHWHILTENDDGGT